MVQAHRTLLSQTLSYFSRPHEKVPTGAIESPGDWRGHDLVHRGWTTVLGQEEIDEISSVANAVAALEKPLGQLTRQDFRWKKMEAVLEKAKQELAYGSGAHLVRGVPVQELGEAKATLVYWGMGMVLGTPGAQDPQGRLIESVKDRGPTEEDVRLYKTSGAIAYHCDAADVVGLLCLARAQNGGRSRIASSVAVFNELRRRRPDLAERLFQPFALDAHGENGVNYIWVRPCCFSHGTLKTFYHADYFRSARKYPGALSYGDIEEVLKVYEEIANSPEFYLEMDIEVGDIQLLSNHSVVHSRTAYSDGGGGARHLLRLWLTLETPTSLVTKLRIQRSKAQFIAGVLQRKLAARFDR